MKYKNITCGFIAAVCYASNSLLCSSALLSTTFIEIPALGHDGSATTLVSYINRSLAQVSR
jgi:hypothetical protein